MTGRPDQPRAFLVGLLERCRTGGLTFQQATQEARAFWLSRSWPSVSGDDPESIAMDVASLLATARDSGITHEDIPALLAFLATPVGQERQGREQFGAYVERIDTDQREALQATDYYGPPADDNVDRSEISIGDPEHRRIHRGVRLEPESVWEEVRGLLCAPPPRDHYFAVDLIEDLLSMHAEAFIERLEDVARDCPYARLPLVEAHIGGMGATPALDRFDRLQERLRAQLAEEAEVGSTDGR